MEARLSELEAGVNKGRDVGIENFVREIMENNPFCGKVLKVLSFFNAEKIPSELLYSIGLELNEVVSQLF